MKKSNRARRMERHHARARRGGGLNLVSLMDIFTILVFFLLVNSAEVQTLETPKDIKLPESVAENKPRETVVVHVSHDQVLVKGAPVTSLAEIAALPSSPSGHVNSSIFSIHSRIGKALVL